MIRDQIEILKDIKNDFDRIVNKKIFDGLDGDLCGALIGKMKFAGRDAAEGDRSETIFDGDFQTGSVAIGEKFFVSGRQAAVDDRTDGMNDEL